MLMHMTQCNHQGMMIMQVTKVAKNCQVDHLQMNSYKLVAELISSRIGFNILVKNMRAEQVYIKRRCHSYSSKLSYIFL